MIAYENATLTGTNVYNLTGLARALSGSSGAYHSSGAPFARLDGAVVKYSLPANLVGVTLYFKFQSFNVFGGGLQDLSTCAVYVFTPAGTVSDPIAAQLLSGIPLDLGQVIAAPTLADDFGQVTAAVSGVVDLGQVAIAAHPIAVQLLAPINPLSLGSIPTYPTVFDDFGSVADAVVDVINLGTVP